MLGPKTENEIGSGSGNTQAGRDVIGISAEEHGKLLQNAKDELRTDLEAKFEQSKRADDAERKVLEIEASQLSARIADLESQLAHPDESFAAYQARIMELEGLLERSTVDIRDNRIQDAKAALEAGDTSKADAIFAEVEELEQAAVERKADAALGRGLIAENDVRWRDAAKHYEDAARLHPTFDSLSKAGEFMSRSGNPVRALRYNQDLLDLTVKGYGRETVEFTSALNNLALRHKELGDYQKAEELYRQALEIYEKNHGTEYSGFAISLNNLANVLRATGRYEEAERLFRRAMSIDEKILGVDHPDYAIDLNNLGLLLRSTGRYDEAESLFRQALEIGERTVGSDHPTYAIRLNNLANVLRSTGRYDEAETLFRQAMVIDEKTLGVDHPDYAIDLNNLGHVLRSTGRIREAEELYRKALAIFESALGADHPDTTNVRSGLNLILTQQSK